MIKILYGLAALILIIIFFNQVFLEPWIEKKIKRISSGSDYSIEIGKVHTLIFSRGVEFKNVKIYSNKNNRSLHGEAEAIKIKGINLVKLLFHGDLDAGELILLNSDVEGKISSATSKHIILPLNIHLDKIILDNIKLEIQDVSNSASWLVEDGVINLYDFKTAKADTLHLRDPGRFDLKAEKILVVSPDGFYTLSTGRVFYSGTSNTLQTDLFLIHPNYSNYDFTSRHEFQTDRIEAEFKNVSLRNFSASDYFKSNALTGTLVKIESMDINVFRDRRKKFQHVNQPMPQEIIYKYNGKIDIDTVNIAGGKITYTEHAENAKEPGTVYFNKVSAQIYHITNDTMYKTKNDSSYIRAEALLMGKAKVVVRMKAKLFDSNNSLWVEGGLSKTEAQDLNPMLERAAFIHAESGTFDTLAFSFTANNHDATGNITMLYNRFFISTAGKQAEGASSLFRLLLASITSKKITDANPLPGEKVRAGVIDYQRDPERFIFNYYFKAILSGVKSVISKNSK